MSKASNVLQAIEEIYRKTRKPHKKRREEDERRAKAAEFERQSWREDTFPKDTGYKKKEPPRREMSKEQMKDVRREIEAERQAKKRNR